MKTSILIVSILGLTSTAAAGYTNKDPQACADRNPSVLNAIGQFCQKRDIYVPTTYASEGKWSDDGAVWININGDCNPPQFVDWDDCFHTFYNMCAGGLTGRTGMVERKQGNNDCQLWQLGAVR